MAHHVTSRGRKPLGASGLSNAPPLAVDKHAAALASFEATVAPAKLADCDDPLASWLAFLAWTREHATAAAAAGGKGGPSVATVLERCVGAVRHDPRYRNDDRFVKVIVEHADKVASPDDLFSALHKDKVGAKVRERPSARADLTRRVNACERRRGAPQRSPTI
jgi:hypothetical protein